MQKQTKVIKRYANRKLYDTERSCYVTLDEIAQMIKDGDDVRVVDNKSKDDLTAVTMAQIIVEEEKKVAKMPLKLLKSIIRSGNDAIGDFYEKRVAGPAAQLASLRDDVERRVDSLLKRERKEGEESAEGAAVEAAEAGNGEAHADADPAKASVLKEFVSSTGEAFESWQRRIDERVKETMAKMAPPRPDVEKLKNRIEELEARLAQHEAQRADAKSGSTPGGTSGSAPGSAGA